MTVVLTDRPYRKDFSKRDKGRSSSTGFLWIGIIEKGESVMLGGSYMLYPIFSYDDGTEVTASKPDENGKVLLYVEKFDVSKDEFINATFVLPNMEIKNSYGYNESELDDMVKKYSEIQEDIISYVTEKVKRNA